MSKMDRPLEVTIIGIGFIAATIFFIVIGVGSIIGIAPMIWQQNLVTLPFIGGIINLITPFYVPYAMIWGIALTCIGIIPLIGAIGMFTMKEWAHTYGLLLSIIAIVIIAGILFIIWLTNDDIKGAFGKN